MAMSADGKMLYAVNTPDNRLEIYDVKKNGLAHKASVLVGIEPVAVAVAPNGDVWVINHVSDSVSIVDVTDTNHMRVIYTLLVGDEPRDIVFAGPNRKRAFITTAHRGQNSPVPLSDFTTPGIGRADVWVFDSTNLGNELGGTPLTIVTLFMDTPRALAVSPNGEEVYVAGFKTGNQTTTLLEMVITPEGGVPGADFSVDMNGDGIPEPHIADANGVLQPLTSLIVKFNGTNWVDETGKIWDDQVNFNLPDKDVFVIDAMANVPTEVANHTSVGTVLYNMAVNPVNGNIYVSNTEARNHVRFEGPGGLGSTVRGHFVESRITVIDGNNVAPRHLNKHINYAVCCNDNPAEKAAALAQPMEMAVSSDGNKLYVAAFGSNKVGILDTAKLEDNSFTPNPNDQVAISGGGPSGVLLDETNNRLYVLTRFDGGISIIDTNSKTEVAHIQMHNPEPAHIRAGRQYHYDANLTSSHGDSSCALCHVFGDMDQLAWDLGNPDGSPLPNYAPLAIDHQDFGFPAEISTFMNMKGPMTTQSMKGMANHGAQHWRGDRTGANGIDESVQPDGGVYNEVAAFMAFNPAFVGLNGRSEQLSAEAMQEFTDFALELSYPPNPIRNLDNSLTEAQALGRDFFFDEDMVVDTVHHCNGCHVVDRDGNEGLTNKPGFFGTDGKNTFAFQTQFFKVPHLRNLYQKVGMFGMANNNNFLADDPFTGLDPENMTPMEMQMHLFFGNDNQNTGDQIRGFGMFHDGSVDTIFRFHNIIGFLPRPPQAVTPLDPGNPDNLSITPDGMQIRRNLEQYLLVFDSNLFPIVGQQVTLTKDNAGIVNSRIDLLVQRASLGECDLIASQKSHSYLFDAGANKFLSDLSSESPITDAKLRTKVDKKDGEITYTCTPPGNGLRLALDRDMDGVFNRDEKVAGTDPADASSH
jgi:DNA-binding beta-propeller fold protein YncE